MSPWISDAQLATSIANEKVTFLRREPITLEYPEIALREFGERAAKLIEQLGHTFSMPIKAPNECTLLPLEC